MVSWFASPKQEGFVSICPASTSCSPRRRNVVATDFAALAVSVFCHCPVLPGAWPPTLARENRSCLRQFWMYWPCNGGVIIYVWLGLKVVRRIEYVYDRQRQKIRTLYKEKEELLFAPAESQCDLSFCAAPDPLLLPNEATRNKRD